MIKLIASDLDGTLIGPDFRFRPRTLHALEAARAAGIDIVFVTGRRAVGLPRCGNKPILTPTPFARTVPWCIIWAPTK